MTNVVKERTKQNPCLNCPAYCCSENLINICGYDARVIARDLNIHPADFIGLAELHGKSPYNFILDNSGNAYYLVLNMRELADGSRRCIFALDLPNGVVRCGIYSLRPIACRAYPLILTDEEVVVKPWAFFNKEAWDIDQLDKSYWREELGRNDMEFSIYGYIVAVWNNTIRKRTESERLDFSVFFDFLFNIYRRLESERAEIPAEAWPEIWTQWRQITAQKSNPLFLKTNVTEISTIWDSWILSLQHTILEENYKLRISI
jgi:Fe-S-cluster containining protein